MKYRRGQVRTGEVQVRTGGGQVRYRRGTGEVQARCR